MTSSSLGTPLADTTPAFASGAVTSTNMIDLNAVFTIQSSDQLSALAPQNDAAGNAETGNDVSIIQDQSDGPQPARTAQMWHFVPQPVGALQATASPDGTVRVTGAIPVYEVMNVASNRCLSVFYNGTTVGTKLVQYDCHAWPDQLWGLNRLPTNSFGIDGYQIQSVSSGLWASGPAKYDTPLDPSLLVAGVRNTTPLTLSAVTNALTIYPKHIFSVQPGQKYRLTTANSLALDVEPGADDARAVQTPVQLWKDQSWTFTGQTDGSFAVANSRTGECLSVYYGSTAPGAGLVQYTCHGWTDQEWDIVPVQNPSSLGYSLQLRSRSSGLMVEVPGDTIVQGTQFDQWPSTGGYNQRFVVTAV